MLFVESKVNVGDNSGVRKVKCLKFLKGLKNNNKGVLGGIAVVSLVEYKKFKQKSTRKIYLSVIVTMKQWTRRKTGFFIKSNQNRVVLLDSKDKLLAKVVKGPIPIEIRRQKLTKILFIAKTIY